MAGIVVKEVASSSSPRQDFHTPRRREFHSGGKSVGLYRRRYRHRDGTTVKARIWWMAYTANGRHRCESTGTSNRRLAQKILAIRLAEIARGSIPRSLEVAPACTEELHFSISNHAPTFTRIRARGTRFRGGPSSTSLLPLVFQTSQMRESRITRRRGSEEAQDRRGLTATYHCFDSS